VLIAIWAWPGITAMRLFGIGLAHVFAESAGMRPLVEAAGLPAAALLAPLAVAIEVVAGASLLLGAFARVGAALAIPTMLVAAYAHLAIAEWPNGAENEPPLLLPPVVMAAAACVLLRGAGRWSLDARALRQEA
jgi:putative oxidoreductase